MSDRRTHFGDRERDQPVSGSAPADLPVSGSRPAYPGWTPPPLPGGPTPTTPGGYSTVESGTGLHADSLVGPNHRIPILFGRCLLTPDLVKASGESAGGVVYGRYHAVISEGPIDAIESWYGATSFQSITTTLGSLSPTAGMPSWSIGLAAANILTKAYQPWFPQCIARGRKVFDPRLGAWGAGSYPDLAKCAYSTNPALIYTDLRTFPQYGVGWPNVLPSLVNWSSVSAAANYFDELIGSEKRYELNLYLQAAEDADSWLKTIELHAGLRWREEGGLYHLDYSAPSAAVAETITKDHLVKGGVAQFSYGSGAGLADRPNVFVAEWIDPASNWATRTVTVKHPAVEAGTEAARPAATYKLHGFQSETMCLRALWRIAHEIWSERELELELTTERLDLVEGSRVPVTLPALGLSASEHLVTRVSYDGDRIRITARRYDASTWAPPGDTSGTLPGDGYFDTPPELVSVTRVAPDTEVTAVTPTAKTTLSYLAFQWTLPTFSWPGAVVVRVWPAGTVATWDTVGFTEYTFDAKGEPRWGIATPWKASCKPAVWDTTVLTFEGLGNQIASVATGAGFVAILKLKSLAGIYSATGVTISEAAHSTTSLTPATEVPITRDPGVVPTGGQIAVWDSVDGKVTFPGALALVTPGASATIGGRMLIGTTVTLTADVAAGDGTIYVNRNTLASGDRIMLESAPGGVTQTEFMAVTSAPSGAGPYAYTVTRNLDGSGANAWKKGDAAFSTGQTGASFIDLYSARGLKAATQVGPTIVGNKRNSATWNDWTPRWALGNLNGIYGYAVDTYGAAFGSEAGAWLKVDGTNGIRLGHNATTKVQVDASGNATFTGAITAASGTIGGWEIGTDSIHDSAGGITLKVNFSSGIGSIYIGAGHWANADTAFYVDGSSNFSLGDKLTWDGSDLVVKGGDVTIDSNGIWIPPGTPGRNSSFGFVSGSSWLGGTYATASVVGLTCQSGSSGSTVECQDGKIVTVGWIDATAVGANAANPGSGYFNAENGYKVGGLQVVGARQSHITDATNATDVITRVNAILSALETHGLLSSF